MPESEAAAIGQMENDMKSEQERYPNILIVDWNEVNARSLANMLHLLHFHADQTDSGQNVLPMLQKNAYDIIFVNHWMPDMGGQEITKAIRGLQTDRKPIIYVLAPSVSPEIFRCYREAGANRVFEKPLKLDQFLKDLKLYFPDLSLYITDTDHRKGIDTFHWNRIRIAFAEAEDINIEVGIRSSLGNHKLFIQIMNSTYHEMEALLTMLKGYTGLEDSSELKLKLHNLKSVLSYIGAVHLLEATKKLEIKEKSGLHEEVKSLLAPYSEQLRRFLGSLKKALEEYHQIAELRDSVVDTSLQYNPEEAYEQCVQRAIYYIKRFEYDLILQELNKLISFNNEHRHIFIRAAEEVRNFKYENALKWISQLDCRKDK